MHNKRVFDGSQYLRAKQRRQIEFSMRTGENIEIRRLLPVGYYRSTETHTHIHIRIASHRIRMENVRQKKYKSRNVSPHSVEYTDSGIGSKLSQKKAQTLKKLCELLSTMVNE